MLRSISRRLFLGSTLGFLAGTAGAKAPTVSLRPQLRPEGFGVRTAPNVERLIRAAELGGDVAFSVIDVGTGKLLESYGSDRGLPPASVTKAVTALYALHGLGAGYRFETQLLATGAVQDGILKGDLILAGSGDPTLDTDALARLAARLKDAGVREVRGKFRTWGGAIPFTRVVDKTQPEHVSYNPSLSGLNLNFNRVHFEWKRSGGGYTTAMDARSNRYRPVVRVARISVAPRALPVYTYKDNGDHDAWTVARDALGNGGARWLPVRKPEAYAAEVFQTFARSHGIQLRLGQPVRSNPNGQVLVTHRSEPLTEILRGMLKFSNNMTAELVGMKATARLQGKAATLDASARAMSTWARNTLGMQGAVLVDHSGLGIKSTLTADAMARALAKAHSDGALKPILKEFPLRLANGQVDTGHPLKVQAKTGTLYFVSSLAGYVTRPSGSDLAFAIFTANRDLRNGYDATSGQRPQGSRGWNKRSKTLQQKLIERWNRVYS